MPTVVPPELPDIQSSVDERQIAIDQVGVCDLTYPIVVLDRDKQKQQCAARLSLSVSLPHHFKGTHMSRFRAVESLVCDRFELSLSQIFKDHLARWPPA